jgi:stage II sporulation protein D
MRVWPRGMSWRRVLQAGLLHLIIGFGFSGQALAMRVKQRPPQPPPIIQTSPTTRPRAPVSKPPRQVTIPPAPSSSSDSEPFSTPTARPTPLNPSLRIGLSLNQKAGLSQFMTTSLQTEVLSGFSVFELVTGKHLSTFPGSQSPYILSASITTPPTSIAPEISVSVRSTVAQDTTVTRLTIPLQNRTPDGLLQGVRLVGSTNTQPLWRLANKSLYGQQLSHPGILDLVAPIGPQDLAQAAATQGMLVINQIDLETYLKGVLPYEMAPSFPLEALKAQAIVARTFALQSRVKRWRWFDHPDTTLSQVYGGINSPVPDPINHAVEQTRGMVLTYQQQPIQAFFHSTSGGVTATDLQFTPLDAQKMAHEACGFHPSTSAVCREVQRADTPSQPYLIPRPDTFQWPSDYQNLGDPRLLKQLLSTEAWGLTSFERGSRLFRWQFSWPTNELSDTLLQQLIRLSKTSPKVVWPAVRDDLSTFGEIQDVSPLIRTPFGRVLLLQIVTQRGRWFVAGDGPIRQVLRQPETGKPLPSNWFVCERELTLPSSPPTTPSLLSPPVPLPTLASPPTTTIQSRITCQGGGFGHGVGLSQYGASGMALRGQTAEAITRHYFPGVQLTTRPPLTAVTTHLSPN